MLIYPSDTPCDSCEEEWTNVYVLTMHDGQLLQVTCDVCGTPRRLTDYDRAKIASEFEAMSRLVQEGKIELTSK